MNKGQIKKNIKLNNSNNNSNNNTNNKTNNNSNTINNKSNDISIIPKEDWFKVSGFLDTNGENTNPWTGLPYQNLYVNANKFPNTYTGYNQAIKEKLPVFQKHREFLETLATHQVVFVTSGTGSGKTVMVPRFLEHLYNYQAKMIVTIPRQESVREMALYQSKINDVVLGDEIGYAFRGDRAYNPDKTKLLFATDGLLVRRLLQDPLLTGFQAVIVDEAHERNVQIDFLLFLLRRVFDYRSDFRLVIMSAEAPVTLFEKYFAGKKYNFIEINAGSKTTHPIEDIYLSSPLKDPENYLPACIDRVIDLLGTTNTGDILAFVTSPSEAVKGCRQLRSKLEKLGGKTNFTVETESGEENLILFCGQGSANMSNRNKKLLLEAKAYREETNTKTQKKFNRRVTFVTNIAESSITLEGYTYVIDNGYALVDTYEPEHLSSHLRLERISRAQQVQRRGRVGRVGPGVAYYLYTKQEAEKFNDFPPSQISRSDLSESILNFLVLPEINTINELGKLMASLIEPPKLVSVEAALLQLKALGWTQNDYTPFVAKRLEDLKGTFSERGQFMIRTFRGSVPAATAEAIVAAWENHCANEVCGIFSMIDATRGGDLGKLIEPSARYDENPKQEKARQRYYSKEGMWTTLLNMWNKYRDRDTDRAKWFSETGFYEKTFRKADSAYRRFRFQVIDSLKESLNKPLDQAKTVDDFAVEDGEDLMMPIEQKMDMLMGAGDNNVHEREAIYSIAKGYWIYAAHKKGKSYKGCLAPKPTKLDIPENAGLSSRAPWVMGISWGGFGDKNEVNLPQKMPEEYHGIHPNLPDLIKMCEGSKNNKDKIKTTNKKNVDNKSKSKKKA